MREASTARYSSPKKQAHHVQGFNRGLKMKLRAKESVWGLLIWVIMVSFGSIGEVRAQTVDEAIQCDNCPNFREIAHFYGMNNGPGLKVVADFQTGQIKAFKHVVEGPDRYTRPSGVPDNVRKVFDFWMDVMMADTASAEAYGKASEDKARGWLSLCTQMNPSTTLLLFHRSTRTGMPMT